MADEKSKKPRLTKVKIESDPAHEEYEFMCPGCRRIHNIAVKYGPKQKEAWINSMRVILKKPDFNGSPPEWEFNNDVTSPTFSPSILVRGHDFRCHSYVRNGEIVFCEDSSHAFKGKVLKLEEVG